MARIHKAPIVLAIIAVLAVTAGAIGAQTALLRDRPGPEIIANCLPWQKCAIQGPRACPDTSALPYGVIAIVRAGTAAPVSVDGHHIEPLLLDAGRSAPAPGSQHLVFIDDSAHEGDAPARLVYAIHNDARFTDDPLDPDQLIVVVDIAGAPEPPRAVNAPTTFGARAIVAFVDRYSHKVTLVGFAPAWDVSAAGT